MGCAVGGGMDAIMFGLKRAYQSTLTLGRAICSKFAPGLTPARLDMLYAIHDNAMNYVTQMKLRRLLGVSRPTVSRMLKSLEGLGWVERSPGPYLDRRTRKVRLTERGVALLKRVLAAILATRMVKFVVDVSLTMGRFWDAGRCLVERDRTEGILQRIRSDFGDTASLYYPWDHPDD